MPQARFFLPIVFCLSYFLSNSQNTTSRFSQADAHALSTDSKRFMSLDSLALYLTAPFTEEIEKARSVFRWITNAIAYDTKKQVAVFKNENDFSQDAINVLKSRKAVCEGYSNLFYDLCRRSNLQTEVVTGYATADGTSAPQPHAWNAVKINGEWKLIDATWAAGGVDTEKNSFRKSFDDSFFCMNADSFLLTHYPIDPMWQLLYSPVTYNEFKQKRTTQEKIFFAFNDTISAHMELLELDSVQATYNQNVRALQYNPDDFYAKTMLKDIDEFYQTQQFEKATDMASEATQLFNDVITVVNDAKKKRSTKKLNDAEFNVTTQLTNAKQKMNIALNMYNNITFTSGINKITLEENISRVKKNLNMMTEIEKYLARYFKTPIAKRISVL